MIISELFNNQDHNFSSHPLQPNIIRKEKKISDPKFIKLCEPRESAKDVERLWIIGW